MLLRGAVFKKFNYASEKTIYFTDFPNKKKAQLFPLFLRLQSNTNIKWNLKSTSLVTTKVFYEIPPTNISQKF